MPKLLGKAHYQYCDWMMPAVKRVDPDDMLLFPETVEGMVAQVDCLHIFS